MTDLGINAEVEARLERRGVRLPVQVNFHGLIDDAWIIVRECPVVVIGGRAFDFSLVYHSGERVWKAAWGHYDDPEKALQIGAIDEKPSAAICKAFLQLPEEAVPRPPLKVV